MLSCFHGDWSAAATWLWADAETENRTSATNSSERRNGLSCHVRRATCDVLRAPCQNVQRAMRNVLVRRAQPCERNPMWPVARGTWHVARGTCYVRPGPPIATRTAAVPNSISSPSRMATPIGSFAGTSMVSPFRTMRVPLALRSSKMRYPPLARL